MKKIKIYRLLTIICFLFTSLVTAQTDSVKSNVYSWIEPIVDSNSSIGKSLILDGSTTDLDFLKLYSVEHSPGKSELMTRTQDDRETLIIIKEGELEFKILKDKKILGPGSIVVLLPNEEYYIKNSGDNAAAYYLFEYNSKAPVDIERGNKEGGSFMVDWNDITFKPHDKGGIRQYFERATAMFHRFEMHVTTLNPGIKSHEPHTHTSDEMVLMINGNTTMQIGDSFFDASDGDLYFLGANKPHAIKNSGTSSCMYFAFHGE